VPLEHSIRGFSANFWDWLTTMSEEFGYQVS